jgi:tyrosinase
VNPHPTWDDDVAVLFAAPAWVAESSRRDVAAGWRGCMHGYGIELDDYDSVRAYCVTIYEHLASRSMPLTTDRTQFWPAWALAILRAWIEQGTRRSSTDPIVDGPQLPPTPLPPAVLVRRDILELSADELAVYRRRLEQLGATSLDRQSPWQQIGLIHSDWCLHYQEAFLLWHRANLLYFEQQLGMAIPYWNFMSPNATVDGSPEAGLVKPFREMSYVAPDSGEVRPNPLRFAVAKDGRSKACAGDGEQPLPEGQCRYVQRDPVLYTAGEDSRHEREHKLALIGLYQYQIAHALSFAEFSTAEGAPGYPWANILTFNPPPPDSLYPYRTVNFDGAYEQPHDNFHGWAGPDMADNAYTAFDPLFWSYHANIDRVFEDWNRAHPATTFTAKFPLRPFTGPLAHGLERTDPNDFVYTTIGDMAKDSRALGYDYEPPRLPDSSGRPLLPAQPALDSAEAHLYILFANVVCVHDSYTIDVFVNLPEPTREDMLPGHAAHYAGRMTRLGMGVADDKGRCRTTGATRVMNATHTAQALKLAAGSKVELSLIVTDVHSGRTVARDEYESWNGFVPVAAWGDATLGGMSAPSTSTSSTHDGTGGQPCH